MPNKVKRFTFSMVTVLAAALVCLLVLSDKASATRLAPEMKGALIQLFPDGHVRLDGSFETRRGDLYLPLLPVQPAKKSKIEVDEVEPARGMPDFVFFSNGWCYVRVVKKGNARTVILPATLNEKQRKKVYSCKFPTDLIVPENFAVPSSMSTVIGDTAVATIDDVTLTKADFGQSGKPVKKAGPVHGVIFVTSPHTGKIMMVDETTFAKITDFPTEGTPAGMAYADGRLYIADQAKNRILLLDPKHKQFLGQIDLPKRSAPKGLACLSGKLLYCSESATANVDVIEAATGKVLLKTRVATGPGRMEVTPNGNLVVVLNVPTGQVSLIATMNQRVIGTIKVGAMPNAVVISKDSHLAYVSNRMSNTVSVIDLAKKAVISTLKTGLGPTGLALDHDDCRLFVANAKDDTIAVYDLRKGQRLDDIKLPLDIDFPGALMPLRDGKHILISSESTSAIGVLNSETLAIEKQPDIGNTSDDMIWVPDE